MTILIAQQEVALRFQLNKDNKIKLIGPKKIRNDPYCECTLPSQNCAKKKTKTIL